MTEKKIIKIEFSEESINEILDLQDKLGLETKPREERYKEMKEWRGECLFG